MKNDELLKLSLELFNYIDGNLIRRKQTSSRSLVGQVAGTKNTDGYIRVQINGKFYAAHKLIYLMWHGVYPDCIDHINGNRSDNRIENLREVTRSQNQWNRKTGKNNTSGIKGVVFDTNRNKWTASLYIDGKQKTLGRFDDIKLAELVVQKARDKHHKEYANHG